MTTPWISRPRWTCKYCNITINDDVPSRMQHENGLRHKGNVERSLRDAYKKSERERAQERANKHEIDKIEKLARQLHSKQDLSLSSSTQPEASTGGTSTTATRSTPQWKPKDKLAAYGSALPTYAEEQAALEEQRLREKQDKRDERHKAGTAGEWQTVTPVQPPKREQSSVDRNATEEPAPSAPQMREKQGRYRADDDEDGLGEIKVKKSTRTANEAERQRAMMPTWTPLRLDTGVSAKQEGSQMVPILRVSDAGTEMAAAVASLDDGREEEEKPSVPQTAAGGDAPSSTSSSLFKKRKTGTGAGAKKVRAVI